ncbi:MAG: amidohydrolase [Caldiserica bacterium]|nr:MAG: amidohydrolase [Caldisericota bacterium]
MYEKIIDFHTHAFPDDLAERALNKLTYKSKVKPSFNGTVRGLLQSMDEAGIEKAVLLNIATKPTQVENIIIWCKKIRSERIIPFPSIHPENENYREILKKIKGEGFKGIKLHPMFQNFDMINEKMFFIYEEIAKNKLILVFHSGYDIAFPEDERASVKKLKKVHQKFPELKIVASHTGGWNMWKEVLNEIAGLNIWIEISMTVKYIDDIEIFYKILEKHDNDKILFGTDAPWSSQKEEVEKFKNLKIEDSFKNKILYENAFTLLNNG